LARAYSRRPPAARGGPWLPVWTRPERASGACRGVADERAGRGEQRPGAEERKQEAYHTAAAEGTYCTSSSMQGVLALVVLAGRAGIWHTLPSEAGHRGS
jgi:hypothetical protein